MPYIDKLARKVVAEEGASTAGELNYIFTLALVDYIQRKGLSYQTINDIVGALEGAKAEFQRRIVVAYEDAKMKQNGDVYPEDWRQVIALHFSE
jgi:hypothetical protein